MIYKLDLKTTNAIHVFVIGVIFVLIGLLKDRTYKAIYVVLALLALCIPIVMPIPQLSITYWSSIQILHWLVFLPALLYFSWLGFNTKNKKSLTEDTYNIVLFLGLFIILYHGYRLYGHVSNSQSIGTESSEAEQ
jgi:hypothetical protein